MVRNVLCFATLAAACAPSRPPTPAPSSAPQVVVNATCSAVEHRQLDFWVGDWELVVRARTSPASEEWEEARGENHVRAILGGCAVEEHFRADGPGGPWAGQSVSTYVPSLQAWRQTWVDDQGSFLVFRGRWSEGRMTLFGEPQTREGQVVQMRMVFRDVTPDAFLWTWERHVGSEAEAPWKALMEIRYARHRGAQGVAAVTLMHPDGPGLRPVVGPSPRVDDK